MPIHDQQELWKALRNSWLADADVVALLADATSIYLEDPKNKMPFPLLIMKYPQSETLSQGTMLGRSFENLQLNYFTTDRWAQKSLFQTFEKNWSIPLARDIYQTTNFQVKSMIWQTPVSLGRTHQTEDDQDIFQYAMVARLKVNQRGL